MQAARAYWQELETIRRDAEGNSALVRLAHPGQSFGYPTYFGKGEFASLLGTRPETIARTIRTLEQDQVASFSGRRVMISDLDNLLDEIDAVDH